ncbi:SDR family oxidoreductase [Geodermatophilus poikilotrophus]|uniref:Nucleoside-diphosphate-sugar epimerase n=1 Tax=Geodermatophilus poikilotrophus TaxID=1333667 RepID=A0A1I0D7N6_9ACTN|nr:NAD(P)H-binding protein [Geodermatophilus poikilotrophus]SET27944.1 Nucleoside-diphosphate-sugar epimerase [Geodermatophilus poikilotrophus]
MTSVLVTGGTGQLGRQVVRALAADGHTVRILSRRPAAPPVPGAELLVADLSTGAGLRQAVAGTTAIVHCATDPRRSGTVDVGGTARLLEAARDAGRPLVVHVSIVGIDRVPTDYYRSKLAAEEAIGRSGLPWTVLRTTQFHGFVLQLLDRMTRLPVVPVPRGWRVQPIDVDEVAGRLADAVVAGPAGRLPDLGGPEVFPVVDLVRNRMGEAPRRRPVLELPLPGAVAAALRAGANLVPGNRSGGRTWREFVAGRPQPVER